MNENYPLTTVTIDEHVGGGGGGGERPEQQTRQERREGEEKRKESCIAGCLKTLIFVGPDAPPKIRH